MSGTQRRAAAGLTAKIGDQVFTEITRFSVARDLQNIAGTFEVTVVDEARVKDALLAKIGLSPKNPAIKAGDAISFAIDGEPALVGWIDVPHFTWKGDRIECQLTGRDKTGDLVECAALPSGPAEFRGVDLLYVAKKVCEPYGIVVKADVDIGAPFERLALHKHQTALTFLESAARQRSVLLVSDGVGGLLLTRGGSSRGPSPLRIGFEIQDVDVRFDWTKRFSDYFVTQDSSKKRSGGPALDSTVVPVTGAPAPLDEPGAASEDEAASIGTMGHAKDPDVKRWRPTVRLTRSQSGMDTVQEQAEWMARVAKGESDKVVFQVLEWRAGEKKELWRPNQVVAVTEPYSGISRDMLIAGVTFQYDEEGRRTRLRVAGVTAYDRINEAERSRGNRGHRGRHGAGALDSTVVPLTAR